MSNAPAAANPYCIRDQDAATRLKECGWNDAQAGRPMRTQGMAYDAAIHYREGYSAYAKPLT